MAEESSKPENGVKPDENTTAVASTTDARPEITEKIHYPSFFVTNFGIGIAKNGDAVAELGTKFAHYSAPRQRAVLLGLNRRLEKLEFNIAIGRELIQGFIDSSLAAEGKNTVETTEIKE